MACLYKRKKSPFWWVKFRDAFTGKILYESTHFKWSIGADSRRAHELEAEKTLAERATARVRSTDNWDEWVPTFLSARYSQHSGTLYRYQTAWRSLRIFLKEMTINSPRNLTREHCNAYFAWRAKPDIKNGKYRASHNTTLLEIKTLSMLMREGQRRGYTKENPARDLGIKRAPRKLYPELTDEAIATILSAIPNEPEPRRTFLMNSYLIARWHGVRLNETYLNPQTQVWQQQIGNESRWMVLFHQKGGKQRPKILHPKLIPLMTELKKNGAVQTYERPDKSLTRSARASRTWFEFLRRCGLKKSLPNVCFHSLRVTAASRLARSGVSEHKAMEYLSHASTTVHEAYIRWRPEDMDECHDAI